MLYLPTIISNIEVIIVIVHLTLILVTLISLVVFTLSLYYIFVLNLFCLPELLSLFQYITENDMYSTIINNIDVSIICLGLQYEQLTMYGVLLALFIHIKGLSLHIVLYPSFMDIPLVLINSDDDEMYEKVTELENEYNDLDREIEQVKEELIEQEENYQEDEEETELSKEISRNTQDKDRLIASYQEPRDEVLEDNYRAEKSLALEQTKVSIEKDLDIIEEIKDNIPQMDEDFEKIENLEERLEDLHKRVCDFEDTYHKNDLPSKIDQESQSSANQDSQNQDSQNQDSHNQGNQAPIKQDSSDVYKSDFDPSDYYED